MSELGYCPSMIVRFGKFPRPSNGNACDGKAVTAPDGSIVARIERELKWIDTGSVSCSYTRFRVTGYRAFFYVAETEETNAIESREFATLGECADAIRAYFAKK